MHYAYNYNEDWLLVAIGEIPRPNIVPKIRWKYQRTTASIA